MREYFFMQTSQRKLTQRTQSFYHKVIKGNKVNMFEDNIFLRKRFQRKLTQGSQRFYHKEIKGNKNLKMLDAQCLMMNERIFLVQDHKGNW
jgi:hypothetical protein